MTDLPPPPATGFGPRSPTMNLFVAALKVSFRQREKLRTVHGFRAKPGYDLASGIGTVDAPRFVFELARAAAASAAAEQRMMETRRAASG